jgi:hypothetical protein
MHRRTWTNATGFEEFEEVTVALINAADQIALAGLSLSQKQKAAMAAAGGAFHFAQVAVRAGAFFAELGEEFGFEIGGDGVLEALGFVVNLPPFHAEKFGEHAFDQMVAESQLAGDFAPSGGEADVAVGLNADEGIFFQAAQSHGYGGSGDFEPVGEPGGDYGFAFAFGFEDGFKVVLFGDSDHWRDYTTWLIVVKDRCRVVAEPADLPQAGKIPTFAQRKRKDGAPSCLLQIDSYCALP